MKRILLFGFFSLSLACGTRPREQGGFEVQSLEKGAFLHDLGIQTKDIILEIDGHKTNTLAKVQSPMASLQEKLKD